MEQWRQLHAVLNLVRRSDWTASFGPQWLYVQDELNRRVGRSPNLSGHYSYETRQAKYV
jgi:hypothetical protein